MKHIALIFVILTYSLVSCTRAPCRGLFCKNSRPRPRNPRPGSSNRNGGDHGVTQRITYFIQHPQKTEMWCERLEAPVHGQLLPSSRTRFGPGESVTYRCPGEYRLVGHPRRTCSKDGTWSGKPAFCRRIDCGNPVIPNGNATLTEGKSTYRSVAHARCHHRPEIVRPITCDRHGLWRPRIHCRPKEPGIERRHLCKNPHLSKCLVEKSMKEHSLLFRPGEGQQLFGNTSSTCLHTGQWYPDLPKCYKNCLTPHIQNALKVSGNGTFTHGQHLHVGCVDGYTLSGRSTIRCSDGVWKPSLPTCSAVLKMNYLQDVSGSASKSQLEFLLPLYVVVFFWYSL